jgi:hypothetical protein
LSTPPSYSDGLTAARIARLARDATSASQLESQIQALTELDERNQRMLENMRREGAKKDKEDDARWTMASAGSLWMARNIASEETTLSFLKSVTDNSALASKLAPQVFKLFKSRPSGAALLLAVGAGATYYLYEAFGFDNSVKPVAVIHEGQILVSPAQ